MTSTLYKNIFKDIYRFGFVSHDCFVFMYTSCHGDEIAHFHYLSGCTCLKVRKIKVHSHRTKANVERDVMVS